MRDGLSSYRKCCGHTTLHPLRRLMGILRGGCHPGHKLKGGIPTFLSEADTLDLSKNKISDLKTFLCEKSTTTNLGILDLSNNQIMGQLPDCWEHLNPSLQIIDLSNNRLSGKIPQSMGICVFVSRVIDFSSNDFTSQVPKEVGYLLGLVSLNLSRNNLRGEISSEIGNLNWLEFLDLSRNHLTGKIPSTLSKIDSLGVLDLSNNNLSGRIPWEGHLETFDASSFEGNIGLCGQQLNKSCPGDETIAKPQGHVVNGEDDNSIFYQALYMSLGLGFFAGFWGLLGPILLCQPWRNTYDRLTDSVLVMVQVNAAKCHRWLKGQQSVKEGIESPTSIGGVRLNSLSL
ncbi:Leucine-rich repeat receptor-like kinase protein FLORAL ORGAN NUMBER1, partial [Mucuna pruriens]